MKIKKQHLYIGLGVLALYFIVKAQKQADKAEKPRTATAGIRG